MNSSWCFRAASILIALFALGHTLGFRQTDPTWGVDAIVASMKMIRFTTQGFSRSYWDFFVGFGLFVTVFLAFAALLSWQLGSMTGTALISMRTIAWALTACFGVVAFLSWRYFSLSQ
jgi:hypothetical protein